MTLVSVFLMNFLCAMVPCDYKNPHPEILYRSQESQLAQSSHNSLNQIKNQSNFLPESVEGLELGSVRGKRLISNDYPVVQTNYGKVQGYSMMVMSGRRIFAFEGIPYADAPVRFQDAQDIAPWTGIRTAFQPGPYCLQIHAGKMFRVLGSENCLTLNIYSPRLTTEGLGRQLPVIVFIHGGSFAFGAGAEFGPSYLLEKDVILVSLNYRLGVLGFMSTGDDSSPGNYGLKDQALALKWVNENIAWFGGDPTQVTLMGQSAGSVSVHLHMMSNVTREYFRRAVMLSGTAHTHWGIHNKTRARRWTNNMAKLVNCPTKDSKELVNCLKNKDANWLVANQMNLFEWMPFPPVLFAPVIEHPNPSAFITESPEEISRKGMEAKIPAIFQMTSEEGLLTNYALNGMMKIGPFINNVKNILPYYLDYKYITDESNVGNITSKILSSYLGDFPPRNAPMTLYGEMGTDRMFGVSVNKAIKYHSRHGPTFASLFSFLGKYNVGKTLGVPRNELGVAHTEDLYYIFNASLYLQGFMHRDEEAELSKIVVNLLTNFATNGEPLYTDKTGPVRIWDPVKSTDEEVHLLQLNRDVKMIPDPFVKRRKFWESLGLEDAQPISNNYENSENSEKTD